MLLCWQGIASSVLSALHSKNAFAAYTQLLGCIEHASVKIIQHMLHLKTAHQLRSHLSLLLTRVLHSQSLKDATSVLINEHGAQMIPLFPVVVLCHEVLSAATATDRQNLWQCSWPDAAHTNCKPAICCCKRTQAIVSYIMDVSGIMAVGCMAHGYMLQSMLAAL